MGQYGSSKRGGEDRFLEFGVNATDLPANTPQELLAYEDGYITRLDAIVQAAVTTGGTLTVKTVQAGGGGGAVGGATMNNTVGGISTVIANGAAKGQSATSLSTAQDTVTTKVKKGDRIEIVPTGFAAAGALRCTLVINTLQTNV